MTRSAKPYTSAREVAAKSTRHGRVQANASRFTTSKAASVTDSPTLTRWWASAITATSSSGATQRWRMTVDGC